MILLLGGWWMLPSAPVAARTAKPTPPPGPVPGNTLEQYQQRYPELHATGGLAAKGAQPGFSFLIYEGTRGRETTFSETFLPCDPSDPSDGTYLPKLSLVVMRAPDGHRYVLSELHQAEFHGVEELDRYLGDRDKEAALRVTPAAGPLELLKRLYGRIVLREKWYHLCYGNDKELVYQASFDRGTIGSVLLIPDWNNAMPETYPANANPGGVYERIDYLMAYEKLVLQGLTRYVHGRVRVGRKSRRPMP